MLPEKRKPVRAPHATGFLEISALQGADFIEDSEAVLERQAGHVRAFVAVSPSLARVLAAHAYGTGGAA